MKPPRKSPPADGARRRRGLAAALAGLLLRFGRLGRLARPLAARPGAAAGSGAALSLAGAGSPRAAGTPAAQANADADAAARAATDAAADRQQPGADPAAPASPRTVSPDNRLRFPRDHGAHPAAMLEWWYITGWLVDAEPPGSGPIASGRPSAATDAPRYGFQLTFFRRRTPLAGLPRAALDSRFAARQLLMAHVALLDLQAGPEASAHRHGQRLARWSGDPAQRESRAALADTDVAIGPWTLRRHPVAAAGAAHASDSRYEARLVSPADGLGLALQMSSTQPLLLQGRAGFSRKGPQPEHASHYYSQPQLRTVGRIAIDGRWRPVRGVAWLDHEWSDALMAADAVGWDWIGFNGFDGSALTAFQLRRADGSASWRGGSHRPAGGPVRDFAPDELRFDPGRVWVSPRTGGRYPVAWTVQTPVGRFGVEALAEDQELDSRASTGAVYWEGLSALVDASGRRIALGYLEMTGRAGRLQLGG